jgi:hypothetical protein
MTSASDDTSLTTPPCANHCDTHPRRRKTILPRQFSAIQISIRDTIVIPTYTRHTVATTTTTTTIAVAAPTTSEPPAWVWNF